MVIRSLKKLAGTTGLEPATSCVTETNQNSMLLVRLPLLCVQGYSLARYSAGFVPKLFPNFLRLTTHLQKLFAIRP